MKYLCSIVDKAIAIASITVLCCLQSFILGGNNKFSFEVSEKKIIFPPSHEL